jgi:eukaryotic-like serine/threonine-protein kinase
MQGEANSTAGVREGQILAGKYRVERVLGAGGMGVVVAAWHLQLEQRVAIKFLLPGIVIGPESIARFLREARAAARIQSAHVARVLDAATLEDGTPIMVMEFLEGRDLGAVLEERGAIPLEEAVGYILEACEGIAEAHAVGIVHRDLKPSNFFLCDRGGGRTVVKVLDFGVSKVAGNPSARPEVSLTNSSAFLGSPLYMSPEQMASAKQVDQRADIWSLGVTLFQLVSGRPPFDGDSVTEVIASVLQKSPPPLSEMLPNLLPGFDAVLARSLEKDRERRYANVAEFAAALAPFGSRFAELRAERISHVIASARPLSSPSSGNLGKGETSPLAATGPVKDLAHDVTAAAVSGTEPTTLRNAGTTAQPVSQDRESGVPGIERRSSRVRLLGIAAVVVVGVAAATLVSKRGSEAKTVSTAQTPPSAVPSATSEAATASATSASPSSSSPLEPVATHEAAPTASTPTTQRPAVARPPVSLTPPVTKAKGPPTTPPATAPSCHVVQYFDSEGEARFKRECQ